MNDYNKINDNNIVNINETDKPLDYGASVDAKHPFGQVFVGAITDQPLQLSATTAATTSTQLNLLVIKKNITILE